MKYLFSFGLFICLFSCGLQQDLSVSYKLSPGMTKAEVEGIMGMPTKTDFKQNVEEWHYCSTGISSDDFIALFFHEGKLVEKLNYTVTLADTEGIGGHCSKFIKMGNYRVSDLVLELRMR